MLPDSQLPRSQVRSIPPTPSKKHTDGFIFDVIRNGVPDRQPRRPAKMPAYKHAVSAHDAWAIVAYVRTLQAAYTPHRRARCDLPELERAASG
jgi:hypothetical protein